MLCEQRVTVKTVCTNNNVKGACRRVGPDERCFRDEDFRLKVHLKKKKEDKFCKFIVSAQWAGPIKGIPITHK